MGVLLTWEDLNSGFRQEDEFRIYKATAPFDAGSLPAVFATLPPDTVEFIDTTPTDSNVDYYYAVAAVLDSIQAISFVGPITQEVSGVGRYWRIRVIENQSAGTVSAVSADNIEMRSTVGGTDITGDASKAISGPTTNLSDDFAFDGAGGNYWLTTNTAAGRGTHWIGYDFGEGNNVAVKEIVWSKRPDSFGNNEAPTVGLVQYSGDGANWIDGWIFMLTGSPWVGSTAQSIAMTGTPPSGKRFWRIRPTALQGGATYPFSTAEIQMRATPGGADQCTGGQAISSTTTSSKTSRMAFDDITATSSNFYLSVNNALANNAWVGYCFPTAVVINEVTIQVRGDNYGANEALTAGVVESSVNGIDWTTEWSFTTPATWTNNSTEVRTFTRP